MPDPANSLVDERVNPHSYTPVSKVWSKEDNLEWDVQTAHMVVTVMYLQTVGHIVYIQDILNSCNDLTN